MATIPELREELIEIADYLQANGLAAVAQKLYDIEKGLHRRPYKRKAAVSSAPLSPQLKSAIRAYHRANSSKSQMEVAKHFGVNIGRISEVLYGKRT